MKIKKSQLKQIIAEEKERMLEETARSNDELLTMAMTKLVRAEKVSGYPDVRELIVNAMSYIAAVQDRLKS